MNERMRGVRGAVTVPQDAEQDILQATEQLVREMIHWNQIEPDDVASVWITVTHDLMSTFPAKAVRNLAEWSYVPVMCSQEIPVPGSLPRCIRVLMHVHTSLSQREVQHVYLGDAVQLRPDLRERAKK